MRADQQAAQPGTARRQRPDRDSRALPACILEGLASPHLVGVLPGLGLAPDLGLQVLAEQLPCCGGSGWRLDVAADLTRGCTLGERLKNTRRVWALAREYLQRCGTETQSGQGGGVGELWSALNRMGGLADAAWLGHLASISAGKSQRGLACVGKPGKPEAQSPATSLGPAEVWIWAVALAAAWRFGLAPHVVMLGATEPADLLPTMSPRLLVIGQVGGLWDAYQRDKLEALISYAYAAMVPIYLEVSIVAAPPGARGAKELQGAIRSRSGSTGKAIQQRIARLKGQAPLQWLSPGSQAKLLEVCAVGAGMG